MSGFYGADTEQLRSHAQVLKERVESIEDLRSRLDPLVLNEASWQGSDAESFREKWRSETAPRFDEIAGRLRDQSQVIEDEAEQQEEASEATDNSILDLLKDIVAGTGKGIVEAILGLAGGASKLWHSLTKFKNADELLKGLRGLTGKAYDKFLEKLGGMDDLMKKAPWLMKTGRVLGRFLPGLDIISGTWQMVDGIRNGDTFSAVTGGATALGGVLITAGTIASMTGVGAVVGGPLMAVGGVLVGGAMIADGVRWAVDNWPQIQQFGSDLADGARNLAGNTAEVISDTVADGIDEVKDTASDVVDTVSDKVSGAVDGLKNAFSW